MKGWVKFLVIGHRCALGRDYMGRELPFMASSADTAQSFAAHWGGIIKPVGE